MMIDGYLATLLGVWTWPSVFISFVCQWQWKATKSESIQSLRNMLNSNLLTRTIFSHFLLYITVTVLLGQSSDSLYVTLICFRRVMRCRITKTAVGTRKDNFLDSTKPTAHSLVSLYSVSRTKNTPELWRTKDHVIWHLSKHMPYVPGS